MAGFSLWTAHTTSDAAGQVASAAVLQDAYEKARLGVAEELTLRNEYQLQPSAELRANYDQAAAVLVDALVTVQRHGDAADQALAQQILNEHKDYT